MPTEENKTPASPSPDPKPAESSNPSPSNEATPLGTEPKVETPPAGEEPKTPEPKPEDKKEETPPSEEDTTDLGAEAKKEEPKAHEYHGAPEGDYEIVAPDGFAIDEGLRAEFTPIAKELDLSAKGVEKLVGFKAQLDTRAIERWKGHLVELKEVAKKDPEIGGAKYEPAVASAILARDKFGTPAFRKMMNDYGVGAHPEMIRFLAKVQAAVGETPSLGNGDGPVVTKDKPLHEILYKD